ncbi:MAG: DUF448 domain-containing protein [Labilithrix sp.]|nr:DUF448 domain-containing protein [Labilithrix sp.]
MAEHTEDEQRTPGKAPPRRMCAGCGKRDLADGLVRVVLGPDGALAIDLADSKFGRGAHVHPAVDCVTKALRAGFAKAFKAKVEGSIEALSDQIVEAADRRIEGLLAGARRGRLVVAGADSVRDALNDGSAELVLVASDAAAATKFSEIQEAIGQGKAVAWSNKQHLGSLFGRDEVAVCAVLHEGVAKAIGSARRMALPFAGSRSEAWWSSEVR